MPKFEDILALLICLAGNKNKRMIKFLESVLDDGQVENTLEMGYVVITLSQVGKDLFCLTVEETFKSRIFEMTFKPTKNWKTFARRAIHRARVQHELRNKRGKKHGNQPG